MADTKEDLSSHEALLQQREAAVTQREVNVTARERSATAALQREQELLVREKAIASREEAYNRAILAATDAAHKRQAEEDAERERAKVQASGLGKLKLGMPVQLAHGGVKMTVQEFRARGAGSDHDLPGVLCAWHTADGHIAHECFVPESLVPADATS